MFERSIVLDEGTILEEGSQLSVCPALMCAEQRLIDSFEWNISIPRSLAAHDWHPEGRVVHTIFAEVEGEAPRGRRRAASPRRTFTASTSATPAGSRSNSPSPLSTPAVTERPPEYAFDQGPEREKDRERTQWLKGRYEGKRSLMVVHENPGGGVMDLDMRGEGAVPGLGVYNLRFTSDVVSLRVDCAHSDGAHLRLSGRYARYCDTRSRSRTHRLKLRYTPSRCTSNRRRMRSLHVMDRTRHLHPECVRSRSAL